MGRRGPKKKPAALAKRKGTYRPSRNEDQISEAGKLSFISEASFPLPPAELSENAKKVWVAIMSEASKIHGYISNVDLVLFEVYCKCYSEMVELEEESKNRTYIDDNGVTRLNPLFKCYQDTRKEFIRLSSEFGFSPSARTRIKLEPKPSEEDGESFII